MKKGLINNNNISEEKIIKIIKGRLEEYKKFNLDFYMLISTGNYPDVFDEDIRKISDATYYIIKELEKLLQILENDEEMEKYLNIFENKNKTKK